MVGRGYNAAFLGENKSQEEIKTSKLRSGIESCLIVICTRVEVLEVTRASRQGLMFILPS